MGGNFRFRDLEQLVHYDYEAVMHPIEKAKRAGTLNALDRSQQYIEPSAGELLRSLNEAWPKIRKLETLNDTKDEEIRGLRRVVGRYQIANIVLTSIITGLAWEGLKALVTLIR